jgi:hypothetical protein
MKKQATIFSKVKIKNKKYIIMLFRTNFYISKYNQQDASHNLFTSVKCSTRFRRYLRPSSGVQKLNTRHRVSLLVKPLLLPAAIVEELELHSGRQQQRFDNFPMLYIQFLSS